MIGVEGTTLSYRDKQRLLHPAIAGVVLFRRNFISAEQLSDLTHEIHALRQPKLLIAVDHEGGSVQRFKEKGFTHFTAMSALGQHYDQHPTFALDLAHSLGWVLASELLSCGVDFSFTPVCDLDYGNSSVIGNRAFHHNPHVVSLLTTALVKGMGEAGMAAVAKHFPGHGHVIPDTHETFAIDERSLETLSATDIQPFKALIDQHIAAIMAAHVIYPSVDKYPAGMSAVWLQTQLREHYHFSGAIISDDLGMKAVSDMAPVAELVGQFRSAGCDLVLLCNDWQQIDDALAGWQDYQVDLVQESRLIRLHGKPKFHHSLAQLHLSPSWLHHMKLLVNAKLCPFPDLINL